MRSRLTVFFLAFALLWSGFSTFEAPTVAAPASLELQQDSADAGGKLQKHMGTVEDHHLDDLPQQAQGDPRTDTPELPQAMHKNSANASATSVHPCLSAAAISPLLAGLLRPPSSATPAG